MKDELAVREGEGFPGQIEGGNGGTFLVEQIGGSFPTTGFVGTGGVGGGGGKRSRDFGVFLARRGDEEGKGRIRDVDGV